MSKKRIHPLRYQDIEAELVRHGATEALIFFTALAYAEFLSSMRVHGAVGGEVQIVLNVARDKFAMSVSYFLDNQTEISSSRTLLSGCGDIGAWAIADTLRQLRAREASK